MAISREERRMRLTLASTAHGSRVAPRNGQRPAGRDAQARRHPQLRGGGRAAQHRLPRHHHVRDGAPGGAAILDAAGVRRADGQAPDRGRPCRILGGVEGRPHLHLQAAQGRQVPRRLRLHLRRHQGHLRAHHQSGGGGDLRAQGAASGHQADRHARPAHGRLQAGPGEHVDAPALRLALQLRLQRQEAQGEPALSRDRGDGHGRLQVRGVRQGLALARGALRPVLPQGPALPRRLPGDLRAQQHRGERPARRPVRRGVPRAHAAGARPAAGDHEGQGHRAGGAVGHQHPPDLQHRAQAVRRRARAPGPDACHRPLGRLASRWARCR